jgi:dolichol kinase
MAIKEPSFKLEGHRRRQVPAGAAKTRRADVFRSAKRLRPPADVSVRRRRRFSIVSFIEQRIGPTELRRRGYHMLPGFLPLLLWVIPHPHPRMVTLIAAIVIVGVATATFVRFRCIQREREQRNDCIVAVAGYAGSVLATLLLFPAHVEVALVIVGVLAFGDGSATLGGMLLGGRRLPWNPQKTIAGTACFLLVGAPMAALLYMAQVHSYWAEFERWDLSLHALPSRFAVALTIAAVATVTAAIAESLPLRTNDNLRVGVSAAVAASLAQLLIVGWI